MIKLWDQTPENFIKVMEDIIKDYWHLGTPEITLALHPTLFYKMADFFAARKSLNDRDYRKYLYSEFTSNYYFELFGDKIECQLSPKYKIAQLTLAFGYNTKIITLEYGPTI